MPLVLLADGTGTDVLQQIRGLDVEHFLLPLLLQLATIIVVARLFAVGFRRLGQPAVVGEIFAGLVLGPSLLGAVAPQVFEALFRPSIHGLDPAVSDALMSKVLTAMAQLGLVFLLFLIGLEFDFGHLKWNGKAALAVS